MQTDEIRFVLSCTKRKRQMRSKEDNIFGLKWWILLVLVLYESENICVIHCLSSTENQKWMRGENDAIVFSFRAEEKRPIYRWNEILLHAHMHAHRTKMHTKPQHRNLSPGSKEINAPQQEIVLHPSTTVAHIFWKCSWFFPASVGVIAHIFIRSEMLSPWKKERGNLPSSLLSPRSCCSISFFIPACVRVDIVELSTVLSTQDQV